MKFNLLNAGRLVIKLKENILFLSGASALFCFFSTKTRRPAKMRMTFQLNFSFGDVTPLNLVFSQNFNSMADRSNNGLFFEVSTLVIA